MAKETPIVVTTAHRGAFFGYGVPSGNKTIRVTKSRMIVYWGADCRSIVGLAANGPSKSCKVSPAVPAITLQDVTSVIECSPEVAEKFQKENWQ